MTDPTQQSVKSKNPSKSVIQTKNTTFPKYPAYKESGVEWLGEIPEGWGIQRLKFLTRIVKRIIGYEGPDVLSITQKGIKVKDVKSGEGQLAQDYSKYQWVNKGDFAMNHMDLLTGWIDISKYSGAISPDYRVFEISSKLFDPCYLLTMFQMLYTNKVFFAHGQGVSTLGRWRFPAANFNNFWIPTPSIKEQTAIANFLDDKTNKIDQAIAQKEKMIELLKERKQIIIQNAVTKGLDTNVKMKNSGVEWIGEIPEHWEVKKLKNLVQDLESGVSVNASEAEPATKNEIGVLKTSAVYSYTFDSSASKKVFKSDLRRVSCSVKKGRIVISRMNAPELVGASGYVKESYPNLFLPDRLWQTVYHTNIEFDSFWLSIVLTTVSFRAVITSLANGSSPSMKNISKPDFLSIRLPFPSHEEQIAIVNNIQSKSAKIDEAITLQQIQIEKLKEYKATLIDSAVTGKIMVDG